MIYTTKGHVVAFTDDFYFEIAASDIRHQIPNSLLANKSWAARMRLVDARAEIAAVNEAMSFPDYSCHRCGEDDLDCECE